MSGEDERADEIVIIRRRGGAEDDHHHGGVWKIAYADFMTAMMAFFLVMWLINASNTETKSSIASYFNPVKLTDQVDRAKGLRDIDEKANAAHGPKAKPERKGSTQKSDTEKSNGAPASGAGSAATDKSSPATALHNEIRPSQSQLDGASATGDAFRDPFNPLASARQLMQNLPDARTVETAPSVASPTKGDMQRTKPDKLLESKAERIHRDVEAAIKGLGLASGPGLQVTTEGDAIVLSLTDTSTFGMFAIGSAKPSDELVKLVGAITPIVNEKSGHLIIRGHTDSRPFAGPTGNNNWRLAMARAESVYSMLIQSRVDDARFERIEAHADRKPMDPAKPEAAVNRRIDILLRPATP
ncbi:MAG: flagellar motor protein MotB [Hyphomicrobiaceae bacterium]|uniref:flagellar motor protein MotB n=1 Tax=Pseudorhodoplanes sp. TaxID=1934341 RepID=UPI003D0AB277